MSQAYKRLERQSQQLAACRLTITRILLATVVLASGITASGCCLDFRFCRRCSTRCQVPCYTSNCSTQYRDFHYVVPKAGVVPAVNVLPPQEVAAPNQLFDEAKQDTIPATASDTSAWIVPPSDGFEVAEIVPEPEETLVEEPVERVADTFAGKPGEDELLDELTDETLSDSDTDTGITSDDGDLSLADSARTYGSGRPMVSVLDRNQEDAAETGEQVTDEQEAGNQETGEQGKAESVRTPFSGILKDDEANPFDSTSATTPSILANPADPFNLQPLPLLRAIPVDKKDQRIAGIPMSTGQEPRVYGHSIFQAGTGSQLIVLPRRNPSSWQPGLQLEGMNYGLGIDAVTPFAPSEASNESPGNGDVVR